MDVAETYPFWLNNRERRRSVSKDGDPDIFSQAEAVGLLQRYGPDDEIGERVKKLSPEELEIRRILLGPRTWTFRAAVY